jgi:hypothetical protein
VDNVLQLREQRDALVIGGDDIDVRDVEINSARRIRANRVFISQAEIGNGNVHVI